MAEGLPHLMFYYQNSDPPETGRRCNRCDCLKHLQNCMSLKKKKKGCRDSDKDCCPVAPMSCLVTAEGGEGGAASVSSEHVAQQSDRSAKPIVFVTEGRDVPLTGVCVFFTRANIAKTITSENIHRVRHLVIEEGIQLFFFLLRNANGKMKADV